MRPIHRPVARSIAAQGSKSRSRDWRRLLSAITAIRSGGSLRPPEPPDRSTSEELVGVPPVRRSQEQAEGLDAATVRVLGIGVPQSFRPRERGRRRGR